MVYEVEDLKLGRHVAIKFLPDELANRLAHNFGLPTVQKLWVRNRRTMGSDHLPLANLLDEHICDVPSEPMLARFASETDTLASFDYGCTALYAHMRVVNDVLQRPILARLELSQLSGLIRAAGVGPAPPVRRKRSIDHINITLYIGLPPSTVEF